MLMNWFVWLFGSVWWVWVIFSVVFAVIGWSAYVTWSDTYSQRKPR